MKLDKKGMMDDLFDFLFTVIAAFFILIFVGMVLSGGEKERESLVEERSMFLDGNFEFINYLRTPFVYQGVEDEMANHLLRYVSEEELDENYHEELLRFTKEIFNPLEYCFKHEGVWKKVGYGVILLEEIDEDYQGEKIKTDRKFRSDDFTEATPLLIRYEATYTPIKIKDEQYYFRFAMSYKGGVC